MKTTAEKPPAHPRRAAPRRADAEAAFCRMAEIFKCFADPTRLKIMGALLRAECRAGDLTRVAGLSQPAVSHHLKQLRQARLVRSRREGASLYYAPDDAHVRLLFDLCAAHCAEKRNR